MNAKASFKMSEDRTLVTIRIPSTKVGVDAIEELIQHLAGVRESMRPAVPEMPTKPVFVLRGAAMRVAFHHEVGSIVAVVRSPALGFLAVPLPAAGAEEFARSIVEAQERSITHERERAKPN